MNTSVTQLFIAAFVLTLMQVTVVNAQSPSQSAAAQPQQSLKAEELDQLVAPIALYPDTLLSVVLWRRLIRWRSSKLIVGQPRTRHSREIS